MTSDSLSALSTAIGWMYFVAWSVSFYPQVILNYRRKCVVGLSFDFLMYNIQGFLFYSIYSVTKYVAQREQSLTLTIEPNDIAFGVHAVLLTLVNIFQCTIYEKREQSINWGHAAVSGLLYALAIYNVVLAAAGFLPWVTGSDAPYQFNVIEFLGYGKAFISFIKYTPQAYLNWKRQCTVGWSIENVLLDLTGGILSFLQQFLDAYNKGDWSSFTGNIPKLMLALESIFFDILFIFQHYVLYRHSRSPSSSGDPLTPYAYLSSVVPEDNHEAPRRSPSRTQ